MSQPSILYDSHCKLCNAEIEYYRKNDPQNIFNYIDIMDPEFDVTFYQLTKSEVHKYFHVIDENDEILKGVDGFNYIWKQLDKFNFLQQLYQTSLGRAIMGIGYNGFVRARPFLPRKNICDDDYCEL